jgi:NitT/TauT family transport system substrate-binding protein
MPPIRRCIAFACAALLATALPALRAAQAAPDAPASVTIAYQPGIGYANLVVIKEQGTLEKQFPHTTFEWKVLSNGATIRDGMIGNQIQIGAGGTGPFLIGWDRGVNWRLIAALNEMDLWLTTMDKGVKSLKDVTPAMKIGMPGPDSIQAIVLRKAALDQLGNAQALDANVVAISHPDGLQALEHGQLALHLSSPPFEFEEVQAGAHVILRSYDVFGQSTFNVTYATEAFAKQYPDFINTFYKDVAAATDYLNKNPQGAAELLAHDAGGKETAAQFAAWLKHEGVTYTVVPHGFLAYAKFMQKIGMLSKSPASINDIEFPTISGKGN